MVHVAVADGVERKLAWAGCQLTCDVSECVVVVGGGIVEVECDDVGVKFGLSVTLGVALAMALVMRG